MGNEIEKRDERLKEEVIKALKGVYDPEIPVNIYDLGLIYKIEFETIENYLYCTIFMTLTSPGCPVSDTLVSQVHYLVKLINEIDEVDVTLVFDPPWDLSKISEEGREILELEGAVIPRY